MKNRMKWCEGLLIVAVLAGFSGVAWSQFNPFRQVFTFDGQIDEFYGNSVAALGDFDRDGFNDYLVGVPSLESGYTPEMRMARAEVRSGRNGWKISEQIRPVAQVHFGEKVAALGDLDGDGSQEYAVAAPWETSQGHSYAGVVRIYSGEDLYAELPGHGRSYFGNYMANAGDVNGDGINDLVVAQTNASGPRLHVMVFSGAQLHLGYEASLLSETDAAVSSVTTVGAAGDVNGDGFADVYAGTRPLIFYGSAQGLNPTPALLTAFLPSLAMLGAGDLNGDGYDDVMVSRPEVVNPSGTRGRLDFFFGSAGGIQTTPGYILEAPPHQQNFGQVLANVGDINCDGVPDFIATSWNQEGEAPSMIARFYTYHRGAHKALLIGTLNLGDASYALNIDAQAATVGSRKSTDIIVGDPIANALRGQVRIFRTSCSLSTAESRPAESTE